MEGVIYQSIAMFNCPQSQPVDSPRQGSLAVESFGFLDLDQSLPSEVLQDLKGFDRIWLVYDLHLNKKWKPMVRPPRGADKKRGVFATRSPYRPNSIGLSCVQIERIQGRKIYVSQHDLLDQTPILDIKPYIVEADCFPEAKQGWLEGLKKFKVIFNAQALEKCLWLEEKLTKPLRQIIEQQLSYEPYRTDIKRVKKMENTYFFHYRTWRFSFFLDEELVRVANVESNYKLCELWQTEDPYGDKVLHQKFVKIFPS